MPKSKYDIFLAEFGKKFVAMNLRHQKESDDIKKRVAGIIRNNIRSGWLSKKDIGRQHSLLSRSIAASIKEKQNKDIESLKVWEASRLQQLFPELNNE